jgi:RNA polymerase sigma-70 factor (ECF subfamily)
MAEAPPTRPSLLIRLRDFQDGQAWAEVVDVYAPLVYGYVRKRGLQDADAADLTQACLRQVAARVGSLEYDPKRGTFRGWLFTIVRNKLRDFQARPHCLHQGSGDSRIQQLLESQSAPEPDETEWDQEYRRGLLAWAAERVRPLVRESTWKAFWQTAVEGRVANVVAQELGLTVAAVYLAKSRIMARLRALIRDVHNEDGESFEVGT